MSLSQTNAIVALSKYVESHSWSTIYQDLPNASRSGFGLQGEVALLFEHVLDRTPDLVAVKNGAVLVAEVDRSFSSTAKKMSEYRDCESDILKNFQLLKNQPPYMNGIADRLVLCFTYFPNDGSSSEINLIKAHSKIVDIFLYAKDGTIGPEIHRVVIT